MQAVEIRKLEIGSPQYEEGFKLRDDILKRAEDEMKEAGLAICRLKARVSAQGFYEKLGYHSESEIIPGTVPHVMMEKNLISAACKRKNYLSKIVHIPLEGL